MPGLKSLVQSFCSRIMYIPLKVSKRMYRSSAVITAGAIVITVVSFTSTGFGAGGRNAALAYAGTETQETVNEEESEELALPFMESAGEANELVGEQLSSQMLEEQGREQENQANAVKLKEEIETAKKEKEEKEAKEKLMEERRQAIGAESFTEEDYNNLLRIVEAESGICDIEGRIMVANVIINRVKSRRFPNTVSGVIFSPRQFSPVSNGRFYKVKVTPTTVEAVERALNGEDNSQGALFFMNRGASRSGAVSWFDSSLTYLFYHDGHEFYK